MGESDGSRNPWGFGGLTFSALKGDSDSLSRANSADGDKALPSTTSFTSQIDWGSSLLALRRLATFGRAANPLKVRGASSTLAISHSPSSSPSVSAPQDKESKKLDFLKKR